MSKLNLVQKLAKVIGEKAGPNTYFGPDINDPDNQCVYVDVDTSKSLGLIESSDLQRMIKARIRRQLR